MIAPDAELLKEMEQDFLAGSREYGDLAALHAVSRAGRESPFPTKFLSLSEKDPDPLGVRHFQELACSAHFAQTGERLDDGWRPWLDRSSGNQAERFSMSLNFFMHLGLY